jgi:DNA-binding NtrC family response regulator
MESPQLLQDPAQLRDFDVIIIDLSLPDQAGLKILMELAGQKSGLPVIVLTDRETILREEELIKAGACDCMMKPVSPVVLEHVLERTLSQGILRRELEYLRSQWSRPLLGKSIGISPVWSEVLATIERAASSDAPVLFVGESGVGKGDAARLLHSLGHRAKGPFVRVNSVRLARNVSVGGDFARRGIANHGLESDQDRFFPIAHGGTLFLEEIGFLPEVSQAQVMHFLQGGSMEISGDSLSNGPDVRLVASATIDLDAEADSGRFRRDLLDLIRGITIRIPPLRERVEDIPLLASAFLEKCAVRLRKNVSSLHPEAMALLGAYQWPGNIRELRNVIDRAVLLAESAEITTSCLPLRSHEGSDFEPARPLNLRGALAAEEKRTLSEALRRARGVRREAARLLGIDPRNLVYFLRKYGLDKREGRE